jgi:hypothetical protein
MNLKILKDIPPWDWPADTKAALLDVLRAGQAAGTERVLAAELAGDSTVVDDDMVDALLAIVRNGDAPEKLRAQAAISLGPVLELADTYGFEDEGEVPIGERTFHTIQKSLRELFGDASIPREVRRRILEASVRAPQDWHQPAVRSAGRGDDEEWKLTAVFCMRFVRGFDKEIVRALSSKNPDIHYEAVCAAGEWGIKAAWPHVAALITTKRIAKPLLLAAIDAVPNIRPQEALGILGDLADSRDEEIAEAAHEAIALAEGASDEDGDDDL